VDVLVGEYLESGQEFEGQPVFQKTLTHGSGDEPSDRQCFLYYWGGGEEGDDDENVGWWFGQDVGGSMVFCFARKKGFPPPLTGWCIPAEEEIPVKALRVISLNDAPRKIPARHPRLQPGTPSPGAGRRPSDVAKAWQPPVPPLLDGRPTWGAQQLQQYHQQLAQQQQQGPGGSRASSLGQPLTTSEMREGARFHRLQLDAGSEARPVGIRLSADSFPPVILEVRAGSLAADGGIKPGFELHAVNGQNLVDAIAVETAKELLRQRPVTLNVKDPGRIARVQAVADAEGAAAVGKMTLVPPGQGRWVPPPQLVRENIAKLAEAFPDDEAYCWERLFAKVQEEREAGATRPVWSRLKAVVATLDK